MTITVDTAAASRQLVTIASFKESIGETSTAFDILIGKIIDRVTAGIERYTNRFFAQETITETLESRVDVNLTLSRFPIISITSIKLDTVLVATTEYSLRESDIGRVFNKNFWTDTNGEFLYEVKYQHGYVLDSFGSGTPTLPSDVELAAIEWGKQLFFSRDTNPLLSEEEIPEVYKVKYDSASETSGGVPNAVTDLLFSYRKVNL